MNRNKRSIKLDLRSREDLELALKLANRADVLVENLMPGKLDAFGLSWDALKATNPSLVYASITGFGDASGADRPGYDLIVQAESGLMDITGEPDGAGHKTGFAVVDVVTGLHAATAILAALHHARATGAGQRLSISLLGAALSAMVNQTAAHVLAGATPSRLGNAHPSISPYEPLPAADRDIVLAVGNDRQFRLLCAVLHRPDLATDGRFARAAERSRHRAALRMELTAALAAKPALTWVGELRAAGVPCGLMNTIAEGVALAQELGLDPVAWIGGEPTVAHPVHFSATPVTYRLAPPALDEHRREIEREFAL